MAQLSGLFRIGRDAEVRHTASDPVVGLPLAFNYYDKNADKNRATQWIEASLWGKRAEALAPYLLKGGLVYATINDPHIEQYEGKNGTGYKLTGKIGEIELAGGKKDADSQDNSPAPARDRAPAPTRQPAAKPGNFDDLPEDDIPF